MSWEQEAMRLRAEVARLEEENAWLKSELGDGVVFPPEWGIRPGPSIILAALYRCRIGVCTTERLVAALEFAKRKDGYASNLVGVYVCHLRKLLRSRFGPTAIESHWGHGYTISGPLRRAIERYLAGAERPPNRRPDQQFGATG